MTNMIDEGIVKCIQYWPERAGEQVQYGSLFIETTDVDAFAYFTIYKLRLTRIGDRRHERSVGLP